MSNTILEQLGNSLGDAMHPEKVVDSVKDNVQEKVQKLGNEVFKRALDALGLTVVFNTLSKYLPMQSLFPFLTGDTSPSESSDIQRNVEQGTSSLKEEFKNMWKSSIQGNYILRFLNNKKPQSIKTACYNLAENFRWTQFKQNLFVQQPSFQNNKESKDMLAYQYLKKEVDNLPQGTAIWVQGTIDPTDTMSSNLENKNHWITYLGKNNQGEPLIADQNGVRPIRDDDFWSKRYIHKIYPPATIA